MKIWGLNRVRKNGNKTNTNRRLRIEQLEDKRLLAIVWANEFGTAAQGNDPGLGTYGANEVYAREIVNRAIDDWNSVITDQNFDNDNDPLTNNGFLLNISAFDFATVGLPGTRGAAVITQFTNGGAGQAGWEIGVPQEANIFMDDNGGGAGWFFDTTPLDDIEFTSVADTFSASFVVSAHQNRVTLSIDTRRQFA